MDEELRQHLVEAHGRWCAELVGLDDDALLALHHLDLYEASLGLAGKDLHCRRQLPLHLEVANA